MIPLIANIRKAIYNLNKRIDIIESSAGTGSGNNFSGDYNDLTNKPTIPEAQIQSDWNQTDNTKKDYIKNKPTVTNGLNGVTPHIDSTSKHWMIGSTDTGIVAEGLNGTNGVTPHIDQTTGNWFIGDTNTGVKASLTNENATSGGTTLSAVTTGEKYNWNNKANIWRGTQAAYELLTPDDNTIYIIIEEVL